MTNNTKSILAAAAIGAAFLIGFIPQYVQTRGLRSELRTSQTKIATLEFQIQIDQARNLAGRMLVQAAQQNYGVARDLSTQFFEKIRMLQAAADDPSLKSALSDVLMKRDDITGSLAQAEPAAVSKLQALAESAYELPDGAGR